MQHWFVLFQSCSTGRAGCNNDSIELNSEHGSFGFKLNFKLKKMSAQQTSTNTSTNTSASASASASASILASNFEDEQQEDVKEKQEENLPMAFHIYNKTWRNNILLKSEGCVNIRVWTSKTRERSKRKGRVCEYSPMCIFPSGRSTPRRGVVLLLVGAVLLLAGRAADFKLGLFNISSNWIFTATEAEWKGGSEDLAEHTLCTGVFPEANGWNKL